MKVSMRHAVSIGELLFSAALVGCSSNHKAPAAEVDAFAGPQFLGSGVSGAGQSVAAGLDAVSCGTSDVPEFTRGPAPGASAHMKCLADRDGSVQATVEWIVETGSDADLVHVRLTLNPAFCDNTYGANAIGWPSKGKGGAAMMPGGKAPKMMDPKAAHAFKDLVGSDHAEFKLSDAAGKLVLHFKADYLTETDSTASGYATLGVTGGEGKMLLGSAADVVAVSTSLDRNLNMCGLPKFLVDSPATDDKYTPSAGAEKWDYRVVYDVWVHAAVFGATGFGDALVDFVHASPSKSAEGATSNVTPHKCPPHWKKYCDSPAGCTRRCGDTPDDDCTPPTRRCGDAPDDTCTPPSIPMEPAAGRGAEPDDMAPE